MELLSKMIVLPFGSRALVSWRVHGCQTQPLLVHRKTKGKQPIRVNKGDRSTGLLPQLCHRRLQNDTDRTSQHEAKFFNVNYLQLQLKK